MSLAGASVAAYQITVFPYRLLSQRQQPGHLQSQAACPINTGSTEQHQDNVVEVCDSFDGFLTQDFSWDNWSNTLDPTAFEMSWLGFDEEFAH